MGATWRVVAVLGTQGTQPTQVGMTASMVVVVVLPGPGRGWRCRSGGRDVSSWSWRRGQLGGRVETNRHGTESKGSPEVHKYISVFTWTSWSGPTGQEGVVLCRGRCEEGAQSQVGLVGGEEYLQVRKDRHPRHGMENGRSHRGCFVCLPLPIPVNRCR